MTTPSSAEADRAFRLTIYGIAAMVMAILAGETLYGLALGSRFLIRDGLEWIYDVLIYGLTALAFGRGKRVERWAAVGVAGVLAAAGVETAAQIIWTFFDPPDVEPFGIGVSGALTIAESVLVAGVLWRFRNVGNVAMEAVWLSARNDVLSSTLSALVTIVARLAPMSWPQMAVDAFGGCLCFQAAWVIVRETRLEARREAGDGALDKHPDSA